MASFRDLSHIASEPNWIAFGLALAKALENPQAYGYDEPRHLQTEVAKMRGVDPSSLRNPVAAVNWMARHVPEALEEKNASAPMTGALLLPQISIMDSDLAKNLARKFFSGKLRKADLQATLRDLRASRGGGGVIAHDRVKQVAAFQEEVANLIKRNPSSIGLSAEARVRRCDRTARVPCDLVITHGDEVVAGVEVKSHRQKTHRRFLLDSIAMTALVAREYRYGILIVPSSWGKAVGALHKLIKDLKLPDVALCVHDPDNGLRRFQGEPSDNGSRAPELKKYEY